MSEQSGYAPIGDYGIVGNGQTTALIHKMGAIDFFCYPRFDSPSVFARLLDSQSGGYFHTPPKGKVNRTKQEYILNTNVLLTRFYSDDFSIDILDFMPIFQNSDEINSLVRVVKVMRGRADFALEADFKLNYGASNTVLERQTAKEACVRVKDDEIEPLLLQSNIDLFTDDVLNTTFRLAEGEVAVFRMGQRSKEENRVGSTEDLLKMTHKELEFTIDYWKNWTARCGYSGEYNQAVRRSALVLKLLTSKKYGSTVAAATFSLPEKLQGSKNWDYRYTWIRDAAFSMYAFMRLGYLEESAEFVQWIYDRIKDDVNGEMSLQIMYKIDGSRDLTEYELDMPGYKGSTPVRVGNAATEQIQLDIFGELMDTIYLFDKHGEAVAYSFWRRVEVLIDWVCKNWETADHGIWEVREFKEHYLYSRVMCWVALDRGIRLVRKRSFPTDLTKWIENRSLIYKDIHDNFWNEELQSYVHYKGATTVDSSLLIMPLVRFISPYDDRWKSTLKVIEDQLISDVLVYRNMGDKIPNQNNPEEGTFLIGAFWYVECLSRGGQIEKASYYFQKLLGYANHLGLFAEEMDVNGEQLGNFPQAFTHLALISAAFSLQRQTDNQTFTITSSYDLF